MSAVLTPVRSTAPKSNSWRSALSANDIYGGVVGTIFASATLAAIPVGQSPGYSAIWVAASVTIAALTRSYGQHVSTHQASPSTSFWKDLGSCALTGIPMVLACLPTLIVLWTAHLAEWKDDSVGADGSLSIGYTSGALLMNAVLLFGWGVLAGRIGGYSRWGSCVVGLGNTALGVVVIVVNLLVK